MTTLTITPKVVDKTARFKGAIAAGEHVAVTIKGGAEWLGTDSGANLTLRVLDLVTGRTLAVFPYWTEDNQEDWPDDVTSADAWAPATDDANDLYCELNLNTNRMVAAARHMLRVPVMFVLGDTDDPRTLYFRDRYEVEYWPERIGDTVPYDLDKWPKQIDEWAEQVAAWTARMDNLALDAERVDCGVTITLNDGTLETPKEVTVYDGEVSRDEMNTAIAAMGATKQNMLTFDDIPTEDSDNPVKSGGVHGAVREVAEAVTEHVDNANIHVTATQKTAWTAKYDKPQGGIPKSDLAQAVKDSLGKADTAVQAHQDLSEYVNGAVYDSNTKSIKFKHDTTVLFDIDATAFIKDGMVSSVAISNGHLVITFNTDAGTSQISIALTDIFNPANYYDKTAADGRFVQKETGKGLVAVDPTLTEHGAAADAKAVGDALRGGFTEWVCEEISSGWTFVKCDWRSSQTPAGWYADVVANDDPVPFSAYLPGDIDDVSIETEQGSIVAAKLTRHLVTPTKTSQLTNDGAPNGGGNAYVMTNDTRLSDARTPTAHTHAMADVTGLNAALAQKANASDLPYRLVEPGKWEFSDGNTHTVTPVDSGTSWYYQLDYDNNSVESFESESDALAALSLTFEGTNITATRASLPGHLLDRAVNAVSVTGATTLTLPFLVAGKSRDFYIKLSLSSGASVSFVVSSGESAPSFIPSSPSVGSGVWHFTEVAAGTYSITECGVDYAAIIGDINTILDAINGEVI